MWALCDSYANPILFIEVGPEEHTSLPALSGLWNSRGVCACRRKYMHESSPWDCLHMHTAPITLHESNTKVPSQTVHPAPPLTEKQWENSTPISAVRALPFSPHPSLIHLSFTVGGYLPPLGYLHPIHQPPQPHTNGNVPAESINTEVAWRKAGGGPLGWGNKSQLTLAPLNSTENSPSVWNACLSLWMNITALMLLDPRKSCWCLGSS